MSGQDTEVLVIGAGAAGLGIARQVKSALHGEGVSDDQMHMHVALLDSRGLIVDDREHADAYKKELAWPHEAALAIGINEERSLEATVAAFKPSVLIGTSGQPWAFHRDLVKTMAAQTNQPVIMPMSNPTANSEATPEDLLVWSEGQALVATGSPFEPVVYQGRTVEIGQGNNVFIFPALGLGTLLAQAREVTDEMITAAAGALADQVTDDELSRGLLYPDVLRLREIMAVGAAAVCRQAFEQKVATVDAPEDFDTAAREAMWWPEYPTFL